MSDPSKDLAHVIVRDLDGLIRFWSSGAAQLYGWSAGEATGEISHSLLSTRFPRPLEEIEAALLREGVWVGELLHETREGRQIRVASHWELQQDASGNPVAVVEANREAEGETRPGEHLSRLAAVLASSDDAIVGKDLQGTITAWSAGAERMLGYTAAEIVGKPIATIIPPDRLEEEDLIMDRVRRGEGLVHHETLRRHKQGHLVPVSLTASPMFDEARQVVGVVKIARDLSETRQSERELARREALLSSILDTVPDALVIIDTNGTIQSFGAAAQTMFGYGQDDVLGRNVSMLMPAPHREAHDEYLAHYARTGERRIIGIGRVVPGRRKDGTTFPLELTVGEVKLPGIHFFTGFLSDLTESEQREQRMHQLQAELAHVSRLSEMGQLASALAHEVNQPLTAVTNYLGGARRLLARGRGEAADAALERALEQSQRARQIIENLREFVRKGHTEHRVEQLPTVINEATRLAMAGARSVQLKLELDHSLGEAVIDKVQIQQVLFNLVRNAIEAMVESPRREITIRTAPADEFIEISVADTGPGLAEEVRANLFQPFTTTKPNGMGIGLSICRGIVQSHSGELRAEAAPGGGTVFRLTVPAKISAGVGDVHPFP